MPFFTFYQNNSGGRFFGPQYVIVEASSARSANVLATEHGVYFDGVSNGMDCDCCGDRWCVVHDDEADDVPSIYGTPVDEYKSRFLHNMSCSIHYLDGTDRTMDLPDDDS